MKLYFTDFADKERPVVHSSTPPANITVKTDDASKATAMGTKPMATDNSGYQTLTSSLKSGVEYTTVDSSGNEDQTTSVQGKLFVRELFLDSEQILNWSLTQEDHPLLSFQRIQTIGLDIDFNDIGN